MSKKNKNLKQHGSALLGINRDVGTWLETRVYRTGLYELLKEQGYAEEAELVSKFETTPEATTDLNKLFQAVYYIGNEDGYNSF